MNIPDLEYRFSFENGTKRQLSFRFEASKTETETELSDRFPDWTFLENSQCPICPLTDEHYCPLATNIVEIIEKFDGLVSHEKARLTVVTQNREVTIKTTIQQGMSSLLGLAIASSNCPHTFFFAPMAHFHKPLASIHETVFRAASSYLLSQYFLQQEGKVFDFNLDGLVEIYKNLQIVNKSIAKRLRSITESDSAVNAIVILNSYAQALPLMVDSTLGEIKNMYMNYYEAL